MCGRYSMFSSKADLEERFNARFMGEKLPHTYNASPSQMLPVITSDDPEKIVLGKWGFLPSWSKSDTKPMINAKAETADTKPFWRSAFKKRHCLVLSDGFYEWERSADQKIPHRFLMKDKEPFAFAGLWTAHEDIPYFAVITTNANNLMGQIHNRMPVILDPSDEEDWLDTSISTVSSKLMLAPLESDLMNSYRISTKINNPKNDSPSLISKIA